MDARHPNFGFAANLSTNAFKALGSSIKVRSDVDEYCTDTILRLDSVGPFSNLTTSKGTKRKRSFLGGLMDQRVGSSLSLGLGLTSSSSDSKGSSATACTTISSAKETDEESSVDLELNFALHLQCEKIPRRKKYGNANLNGLELNHKVDLELSLSAVPSESGITSIHASSVPQFGLEMSLTDEGSSLQKTGITLIPLQSAQNIEASLFSNEADPTYIFPSQTTSVVTTPKSSVTCISGPIKGQQSQHHCSNSKTCQVQGCGKGARGASGRCISHGGGRRCQKPGCDKGAEGRTVYCKAHGGGRRCEFLGCTKSAEGRTDFCIAHGGGRRCSQEGCTRAARGKSGLCIRHGGGKRCQKENCTKSAEGLSGLCISHGGGRRCQIVGCTKGAQGSTMFCKAHGGGKRCTFLGCNKGAEGSTPFCKGHGGGKRCAFQGGGACTKSVHGGTNFCVAHGGGKRCAIPDCTKSARGRTDYCVRHGGGKRCKFEGCGKSAQGSTDFCKAHGGGKRCSWGHLGSDHGNPLAGPCNSFARGKTGLCSLHSGLAQDKRVHGGTKGPMDMDPEISKSADVEDMNVDAAQLETSVGTFAGKSFSEHLLPNDHTTQNGMGDIESMPAFVPEGRVHGGSLLAMLKGSSGIGPSSSSGLTVDPMESSRKSWIMPQTWM